MNLVKRAFKDHALGSPNAFARNSTKSNGHIWTTAYTVRPVYAELNGIFPIVAKMDRDFSAGAHHDLQGSHGGFI
jgi:hypothetical protein